MKKKLFSLILLFCVAVFIVPARQIGYVLYQNLLTEEQATHCIGDDCLKNAEYISSQSIYDDKNITFGMMHRIAPKDFFLTRFLEDINTPPPNC